MFFIFKRVVGMVMQPLALAFILFFIGWVLGRCTKKKRLGTAVIFLSFLLLFLSSFPIFPRTAARMLLENRYDPILKAEAGADEPFAIVVLGNGVAHPGDSLMPALTRLNDTARARLVEGVRLSLLYPGARLVTTGYGMGLENCADAMAGAAGELGVPKERIDVIAQHLILYILRLMEAGGAERTHRRHRHQRGHRARGASGETACGREADCAGHLRRAHAADHGVFPGGGG